MQIDLSFSIKDLDENVVGGNKTAGQILAQYLMMSTETTNAIKFHEWAIRLNNNLALQLDKQDQELLEKFVRDHQNLFVLTKVPMLNAIKNPLSVKEQLKKAS